MRWMLSMGCVVLLGGLLVSCAGVGAGPVRPDASAANTYTVSGTSSNSVSGLLIAQNGALQQAQTYCHGQGRRFSQVHDSAAPAGDDVHYTVEFRCLASDDPRVQHPAVNLAPDNRY